jgi:RNA polymerase sigma-70 factor (ECF subfamily)
MDEAVHTYADLVYRLAVINTDSRADADDVFQNVFLKLMQHQNSIQSEEHLKAWLIRVTVNECRSLMSSPWKKRNVSMEALGDPGAYDKEDLSDVTQAVLSLPAKYRVVIHLFYYEELSIKEIAAALHLSEGGVKARMDRGRKMLAKKLKGAFTE